MFLNQTRIQPNFRLGFTSPAARVNIPQPELKTAVTPTPAPADQVCVDLRPAATPPTPVIEWPAPVVGSPHVLSLMENGLGEGVTVGQGGLLVQMDAPSEKPLPELRPTWLDMLASDKAQAESIMQGIKEEQLKSKRHRETLRKEVNDSIIKIENQIREFRGMEPLPTQDEIMEKHIERMRSSDNHRPKWGVDAANQALVNAPGPSSIPSAVVKTSAQTGEIVTTLSPGPGYKDGYGAEFRNGKDASSSFVVTGPKGDEIALPFGGQAFTGRWTDVQNITLTETEGKSSLSFTLPDDYGGPRIPFRLEQSQGELSAVVIGSGWGATVYDDTGWGVSWGVEILNQKGS